MVLAVATIESDDEVDFAQSDDEAAPRSSDAASGSTDDSSGGSSAEKAGSFLLSSLKARRALSDALAAWASLLEGVTKAASNVQAAPRTQEASVLSEAHRPAKCAASKGSPSLTKRS